MAAFRFLALLGFAFGVLGVIDAESSETKEAVLENYDPDIMPPFSGGPLKVNTSFSLVLVQEVNDDVIKVDGWLHMTWPDSRLANSYSGNLRLPQDSIWVPDVSVYNAVDMIQSGWEKPLAVVTGSGDVIVVDRITTMIPCAKEQGVRHCRVKVGSWTRSGQVMDFVLFSQNIDLSFLETMTKFTVSDTSAEHNSVTYDCCPEPYYDVTFRFTLTDKPTQ